MWPNVGYDGMGGMYYLRVILLKKLEGMAPVPYPIQNRVKQGIYYELSKIVVLTHVAWYPKSTYH